MNPSDELGRVNERLRNQLWMEAVERRRGERRHDQRLAAVLLAAWWLAGLFAMGAVMGASVAVWEAIARWIE